MKVITFLNSKAAIEELAQQPVNMDIAYKLSKLIKEINIVLGVFDKKKAEVLNKYGTYNVAEKKYDFNDATNTEGAAIELQKLLDEDITLLSLPTISFEELQKNNIILKTSSLVVLDWLIKD